MADLKTPAVKSKRYILVHQDDPNERIMLEANNVDDAYTEAIEVLGYSMLVEEFDGDEAFGVESVV